MRRPCRSTLLFERASSVCAEVVHELSSCLARTAEQQQLLTDAARLLAHGEVKPLLAPIHG